MLNLFSIIYQLDLIVKFVHHKMSSFPELIYLFIQSHNWLETSQTGYLQHFHKMSTIIFGRLHYPVMSYPVFISIPCETKRPNPPGLMMKYNRLLYYFNTRSHPRPILFHFLLYIFFVCVLFFGWLVIFFTKKFRMSSSVPDKTNISSCQIRVVW